MTELVIGQYRVTGVLGEGGMGKVYAAEHTLLGRPAAIKVLLPELSMSQEVVQRFFNEARAATAIRHPGIIEIYDFGWTPAGSAFIVMELLQGETLRARRGRAPMPWSTALALTRQIAGALGAAHGKGIVHRDLKPDNIFLVADPEVPGGERIKLLDFGIAKLAGESVTRHKTRTGTVLGTPTYMAPEQCRGVAVDSRADLYALGCILFELCTGQPPFVGEGEGDVLAAHIYVPAPAISSLTKGIPHEVESLVRRMLAKAPAERVQTADEVIRMIDVASTAVGAITPATRGAGMVTSGMIGGATPVPRHVDTTLSSAVSAQRLVPTRPPRRRGRWIAGGAAAIAAGAFAIAVAVSGGGGEGGGDGGDGDAERESSAAAEPAPSAAAMTEPPSRAPEDVAGATATGTPAQAGSATTAMEARAAAATTASPPQARATAAPSAPASQVGATAAPTAPATAPPSQVGATTDPTAPATAPRAQTGAPATAPQAQIGATTAPAQTGAPATAPQARAAAASATPPATPGQTGAAITATAPPAQAGSAAAAPPRPRPSAPAASNAPGDAPRAGQRIDLDPGSRAVPMVDVRIDSTPAGAQVVLDGKTLGRTPYLGALPRGAHKLRFVLRLPGHRDRVVAASADRAVSERVKLEPLPPAPAATPPRPTGRSVNPF